MLREADTTVGPDQQRGSRAHKVLSMRGDICNQVAVSLHPRVRTIPFALPICRRYVGKLASSKRPFVLSASAPFVPL